MRDGAHDSYGLALSLLNAEAHFGMRDQTIGLEHFGYLLFGLDFG